MGAMDKERWYIVQGLPVTSEIIEDVVTLFRLWFVYIGTTGPS